MPTLGEVLVELWNNSGTFDKPRVVVLKHGLRLCLKRGRYDKKRGFVPRGRQEWNCRVDAYRLGLWRTDSSASETEAKTVLRAAEQVLQAPPNATITEIQGGWVIEWSTQSPKQDQTEQQQLPLEGEGS